MLKDGSSNDWIPGLDGLRGLAAIWVMLFHFAFAFLPSSRLALTIPLGHAYLSVDLFLIMSGYVMAHVYGDRMAHSFRQNWKPFVLARIGRLYPLFILTLCLLVAIVAATGLTSRFVSFSSTALALQPFMLQPWYGELNWNYPSWSIGTEIACYAAFIFLAKPLLFGRYPAAIAGILISVIFALCFLKHGHLDFSSRIPAYGRSFAGFGLGVLIFRAMRDYREITQELAMFAIGPFLIAGYFTDFDIFYFCALAAAIVLVVSGLLPLLDRRPFRKLGDWSYGIYLWHAPISFAIMAAAGARLQQLDQSESRGLLFGTSAFVILVAAICFEFFEMPMRHIVRLLGHGAKTK